MTTARRTIKAWIAALAVLLVGVVPVVALAAGAYGEYLPPDQAFKLHAEAEPGDVVLDWRIAAGYYLYREKIEVVTNHMLFVCNEQGWRTTAAHLTT